MIFPKSQPPHNSKAYFWYYLGDHCSLWTNCVLQPSGIMAWNILKDDYLSPRSAPFLWNTICSEKTLCCHCDISTAVRLQLLNLYHILSSQDTYKFSVMLITTSWSICKMMLYRILFAWHLIFGSINAPQLPSADHIGVLRVSGNDISKTLRSRVRTMEPAVCGSSSSTDREDVIRRDLFAQ